MGGIPCAMGEHEGVGRCADDCQRPASRQSTDAATVRVGGVYEYPRPGSYPGADASDFARRTGSDGDDTVNRVGCVLRLDELVSTRLSALEQRVNGAVVERDSVTGNGPRHLVFFGLRHVPKWRKGGDRSMVGLV